MYFTFFNLILKYILRTCQAQNTMLIIKLSSVTGISESKNYFLSSLTQSFKIKGQLSVHIAILLKITRLWEWGTGDKTKLVIAKWVRLAFDNELQKTTWN